MRKEAIAIIILLPILVASGIGILLYYPWPQVDNTEQFVIQGEDYLMPQSLANSMSDMYIDVFDTVLDENNEKELECYKATGDLCEKTKRQMEEDDKTCRTTKSDEECDKLSEILHTWGTFLLDALIAVGEEKEEKMPIVLRLKNTRSVYDSLEIHSGVIKIGWHLVAVATGVGGIVFYPDYNTFKRGDIELKNDEEIKDYYLEIRGEFENNRGVKLDAEKCWDVMTNYSSVAQSAMPGASGGNEQKTTSAVEEFQKRINKTLVMALPNPQKERILELNKKGFDEFFQLCDKEADKFDNALTKKDMYQIIYSGEYLSLCSGLLKQFE